MTGNKKKLGKGAYGDVYLVEDQEGALFALKLMSVKLIDEEEGMRDYIEG